MFGVKTKCKVMNFFNDSFKSLKSALEETINFEEDPEEITRQQNESENLKKLVQHQSEEVIDDLIERK